MIAGWFEGVGNWFVDLFEKIRFILFEGDRFNHILNGLGNTLLITAGALLIGIVIGIVVAAIRTSYDKNSEALKVRGGFGYFIMRLLNGICKIYLTVIRGTPVVVQLMIFYFVIFVSAKDGVPVAIFAFGLNSGAYVAEIFRAGIMSIDNGQFEAGRSLGFNYIQTMWYIVIPQMFKATLPTLCNEFIVLLKETSVAGYVGVIDLTKAGNIIAGRTFEYFIPLITVALIYLVMVMILTWLVGKLERRLRKSER
ncbi:MAG: amino acid ABC transporter permease [Clostridia bacterium]|nr:amino acid ABC transporter permease [Clostridia bacterium]